MRLRVIKMLIAPISSTKLFGLSKMLVQNKGEGEKFRSEGILGGKNKE